MCANAGNRGRAALDRALTAATGEKGRNASIA